MLEYLAVWCSMGLLVAMLAFLEFGRRYGIKKAREAEAATTGKRIVEGSFFGLLSLLIAFSFAGAVSRYDQRRNLILQEANNISTAYLRIDLLPAEAQPQMRELFRSYTDSRLAIFRAIPDVDLANEELAHSVELQNQIWVVALDSTRTSGSGHPNAGVMIINAINSMFDIANIRTWSALTHPPLVIFALLFLMALLCSFIAGTSLADERKHTWTHVLGFAFLTCVSVYVILEVEFPRVGFIDIGRYDQSIVDVRTRMK